MNINVQQSIHIHSIKIESLTNSSVLQIGSAGIIKPSSHLYNTGGFTGPAPELNQPFSQPMAIEVPLLPPGR